MKRNLLLVFFLLCAGYSKGTIHVVTSSGFTFVPATIQILAGDTVDFTTIGGSHTVQEVSQTTWTNNQATPLPGGFALGFGGGTLFTAGLTQGMHYYVCQPHASFGMKGTINVVGTVGVGENNPTTSGIAVYPNPFGPVLVLQAPRITEIRLYNLVGQPVVQIEKSLGQDTYVLQDTPLAVGLYVARFYRDGALVDTRRVMHY